MKPQDKSRYDCCSATATHFGNSFVEAEIRKFEVGQTHVATRHLLRTLIEYEVRGLNLLEVGGGIGTVTLDLMKAGVKKSTFVEISPAFLEAAAFRARQTHFAERIDFIGADFVAIQEQIEPADLVVMDRVVCCYPDARLLVEAGLSKCRRMFGLSYPKDSLASRLDTWVKNRRRRKAGNPFRTFVHSEDLIRGLIAAAGFGRRFSTTSPLWQIEVYFRESDW